MNIDDLRRFALQLLRRQPAAYTDVVNGQLAGSDEHQQPNPEPDHNRPEW